MKRSLFGFRNSQVNNPIGRPARLYIQIGQKGRIVFQVKSTESAASPWLCTWTFTFIRPPSAILLPPTSVVAVRLLASSPVSAPPDLEVVNLSQRFAQQKPFLFPSATESEREKPAPPESVLLVAEEIPFFPSVYPCLLNHSVARRVCRQRKPSLIPPDRFTLLPVLLPLKGPPFLQYW